MNEPSSGAPRTASASPGPIAEPGSASIACPAVSADHGVTETTSDPGAVLVTGLCGFIGSHLAAALLDQGATVIGVDTQPLENAGRTAFLLRQLSDYSRFEFLRASVEDPKVTRALDRASAVVHLAAATDIASSWKAGFTEHASSVLSAQRLLWACGRAGVPRVLVASSSHVYGPGGGGLAREDASVEPTSPYGVAKLAVERLALAYARRPGSSMSAVALRLFTAFGPGCKPEMVVPRMFDAAQAGRPMPLFGDGTAPHSWTYVTDLVDATIRAIRIPLEAGHAQVVNAAGPDTASLRQVADVVGELVGRPVRLEPAGERPGDAIGTCADLTWARQLLGFTPRIGLREGLLRQWEHLNTPPPAAPPVNRQLSRPTERQQEARS
ncbi:NAD-dependent epimerase/dehydratase family protein [Actinomadura sp. SCN-SB]|uniref:NAD-dependent epimerase/dehydratase family protein n=1 Tax=Actinomadura sp. SCN-SB TaxID=3373092 RepID=UPI00375182CA